MENCIFHRTDQYVLPSIGGTVVILLQPLWQPNMRYCWIIRFVCLLGVFPARAQIFTPIDGTYAHKQRAKLLQRLSTAEPDSGKVFLLLDLSNAYLESNTPESALFFSAQAVHLAASLGMHEEEQQGQFLAFRAYGLKNDIPDAEVVTAAAGGIWKMRMLQEISEHYSFRPGDLPANLDSACPYIRRLVALTDTLHSQAATFNTRAVLGKYYYERGELRKGMDLFEENIHDAHVTGDKPLEAHWWSELGNYTPAYAATIDTIDLFIAGTFGGTGGE